MNDCEVCAAVENEPEPGIMWAVWVDGDHPDGPGFVECCDSSTVPAAASWVCQGCFDA